MKAIRIISMFCTLIVLASCLEINYKDRENSLKAEKTRIAIPAGVEGSPISESLTLSSNQSWGIRIIDTEGNTPDWISLSEDEGVILSGISTDKTVELICTANLMNKKRSATLLVTTQSKELSIPIEQEALKYTLGIKGDKDISVESNPGKINVDLKCNTNWTAAISDNNMGLSFSESVQTDSGSGRLDSLVTLYYKENFDPSSTKSATVTFSAEDCEDLVVTITQNKSNPYLTIDTERTITDLKASGGKTSLVFSTNVLWKADIANGATIRDLSLSKTEGSAASGETIEISFGSSLSPADKQASVILSSLGNLFEPITVTFNQTGMQIYISFAAQPFTENLPESTGSGIKEAKKYYYSQDGVLYEFEIIPASTKYFYRHTGSGSLLCTGEEAIKLPAVSGLSLSSVTVTHAATNKTFAICSDESGSSIVNGGEKKALGNPDQYTWNLSGTLPGTSYYIRIFSSSARTTSITLNYAK